MKYIEDLAGLYAGEDIWVVGSGESLDALPITFFEDKVVVGMNWMFSVFLDIGDGLEKLTHRAFYSVHQHWEGADWLMYNLPGFLKEGCLFLLPPHKYRPALCTPSAGNRHSVWWEDYVGLDPCYMRWGICGPNYVSATRQDFADVAQCIADGRDCEYVSAGTTLHWTIQAAAVLGAKKIHLVGCEGSGPYAVCHGTMHPPGRLPFIPAWARGTRDLIEVFAPHGVEIVHYYHGECNG